MFCLYISTPLISFVYWPWKDGRCGYSVLTFYAHEVFDEILEPHLSFLLSKICLGLAVYQLHKCSKSVMVLVDAPVGSHPVYDSDVEVYEPEISTDPIVERLNLVEKENNYLKEKLKRVEEEKMKLELHVADVVDVHKIQMDAMHLKIRKIRNMPLIMRLGIIMLLDQLLP